MSGTSSDVVRLTKKMGKLLHGKPPPVQSAALADLLAMWLAGHVMFDDAGVIAEAATREAALAGHIALVRELIPVNAKIIGTDKGRKQ